MSGSAETDEYYRAIEEEFNRRRGAPLLLSPRDWALIGEWRQAGVPLRIALQGIANVFDAFERRATSARRINSLAYCRQEVLALHEIAIGLRAAAAGRPEEGAAGGGGHPARAVLLHLGRVARRVREAMARCSEAGLDPLVSALAQAGAEIRRTRREVRTGRFELEGLEGHLRRLDTQILEAARAALAPEVRRDLEEACDRSLHDERVRMTAEAFAGTQQAHLARAVRQHFSLPRLTLFD